jgi:hypothetical protein
MGKLSGVEAVVNRGRVYQGAEDVVLGDLVALDPGQDDRVVRADASSESQQGCIGVAASVFQDHRVLVEAATGKLVSNPVWSFTRGQQLFVSASPGQLSAVPPYPGRVQRVGYASSETSFVLLLDNYLDCR